MNIFWVIPIVFVVVMFLPSLPYCECEWTIIKKQLDTSLDSSSLRFLCPLLAQEYSPLKWS